MRTLEYERAEYERVALGELHRILIEPGSQAANLALRGETHGGVRAERIYLDESGPEHEIRDPVQGPRRSGVPVRVQNRGIRDPGRV